MTLKTVTSFKRPVLQSLYSCLNFINSTQHPTSCSKYSHCKRTSSLSKLAGAYIQRRSICSRLLTSKEQQHGVQKVLLNLENRRHVISFHYFTNLRRQRSTHAILSSSLIQPSRFRDFLLESWFFEVSTFGKLKLNCHFPTRVEILDPQEFPDQNKANVYLLHEDILESDESEGVVDAPPVQRLRDIYRFNIEVNEKTSEINIRTDLPSGVSLPLMCLIQIPVKFNLDVNSKSDILVKEFESERIKVVSQNGNCHLSEIKAGNVQVLCENGDILSKKVMHGNIQLTAKSGNIDADRLQGTMINCCTVSGNINVKANYSDSSSFSIERGDLRLQNCHGNSDIRIKEGSLTIDTLDGNLNAELQKGSAYLFAAQHRTIFLSLSDGNVLLKVPEELNSTLDMKANSIILDGFSSNLVTEVNEKTENGEHYLGSCGDGGDKITLQLLRGSIEVETQDWCSSLGIKFKNGD